MLLNTHKQFKIVAEATSAADILHQIYLHLPDILITDIMMPVITGLELAMQLRKENASVKIIALSMSEEGSTIVKMIDEAKVDGYLPKAAGRQELIKAITLINEGNTYYSPTIIHQYDAYKTMQNDNEVFNLSARELQIIQCIINHFNNRQIAQQLFISERTVETHRKNIYRKTNTKGEASLVQFINAHKLLP